MGEQTPRSKRSRSIAPLLKAISTTLSGEEFPEGSECWMRGPNGNMIVGTVLSAPQLTTGRCVVRLSNGVCVQAHRSQLVPAESNVNLLEEVPRSLGLLGRGGDGPSPFELIPGTRCVLDEGLVEATQKKNKALICLVLTRPNEDGRCVVRMEHGFTGLARACRLVHAAQLTPIPSPPAVVSALFGSSCSGRSAPTSSSASSDNEGDDNANQRYHRNSDNNDKSADDESKEEEKPINSQESTPRSSYYAPETDENYSAYYKMLKVGTPAPAVAHRMLRDGRDPRRIKVTEPFAGPPAGEAPFVSAPKARARPLKRRATVKQLPLDFIDSVADNSIWADVQMLNGIHVHRQELEALFVQSAGSPSQHGRNNQSKNETTQSGNYGKKRSSANRNNIDPVALSRKRATNIAIALAGGKLQALSPKFVRKALRYLEIDAFDRAQLEALLAAAPTAEEEKKLQSALAKRQNDLEKSCRDSFAQFAEAERFMLRVPLRLGLRRYYRTVHSLKFCETLDERVSSLTEQTTALTHASQLTQSSDRLKKVLTYILKLSDELKDAKQLEFHSPKPNDTVSKDIHERKKPLIFGFRIASLLRLHELKAFDRRTSALDFVVGLMIKNQDQHPLALEEELKRMPLTQAARVTMSSCVQELKVLQSGLDRLRRLVHNEDDHLTTPNDAAVATIRLDDPDWNRELLSSDSEIDEQDNTNPDALAFFELAEVRVNDAQVQLEEATLAFDSTLEYFGEDPSMTPNEFFSTLVAFVDKFVEARTKQKTIKPTSEERAKKRVSSIDAKLAAMASQTGQCQQATPPRIRRANTATTALETMLQSRIGSGAETTTSVNSHTSEIAGQEDSREEDHQNVQAKNISFTRRAASASKLEAMLLARTGGVPPLPKPKRPLSELPPRPTTQSTNDDQSTVEISLPEALDTGMDGDSDEKFDNVRPLPPRDCDASPANYTTTRRLSSGSVSDDDLDLDDIRDITLY